MRQRARRVAAFAVVAIAATSCGGDDSTDENPPATSGRTTSPVSSQPVGPTAVALADGQEVAAGAPFPEARCEANRAAGTIHYLSGFDFAATASIVDVVVADERGYYDDLCLDVELQPSFSTANYPIVASGDAQFASAGSFSEVVQFAAANDADLVAVAVEGRSAIDSLILKPGTAERPKDLRGTTIGVKGKLPPSVAAMLASAGLVEGEDYDTVLLDGFDPLVHITLPGIVGFPGYKSNEPGQLERAGVPFDLFAPSDYGIPGSFGVLYTTRGFIEAHPIAVQDFLRATMRGLADAVADPDAAANAALELVEAGGNPNFLSPEGERFRWATDVELITSETPHGTGIGIPDPELLQAEVDAYADVGLFGDGGAPDITPRYDADVIAGVYDGATVLWPG